MSSPRLENDAPGTEHEVPLVVPPVHDNGPARPAPRFSAVVSRARGWRPKPGVVARLVFFAACAVAAWYVWHNWPRLKPQAEALIQRLTPGGGAPPAAPPARIV